MEVPKRDKPEPRSTNEVTVRRRMTSSSARARRSARSAARDGAPPLPGSTRVVSRRAAANPDCSDGGRRCWWAISPTDVALERFATFETACAGVDLGDAGGRAAGDARQPCSAPRAQLRRDKEAPAPRWRFAVLSTHAPAAVAEGGAARDRAARRRRVRRGRAQGRQGVRRCRARDGRRVSERRAGEKTYLGDRRRALQGGFSRLHTEPFAPGCATRFTHRRSTIPDHPAYDASPPTAMRAAAPCSPCATAAWRRTPRWQTWTRKRYARDSSGTCAMPCPARRSSPRCASWLARRPRGSARAKELVESVEAFKHARAFLAEAESHRGGLVIKTCFDMACGHGLVGVLFAYAFPEKAARAATSPPAGVRRVRACSARSRRAGEGRAVRLPRVGVCQRQSHRRGSGGARARQGGDGGDAPVKARKRRSAGCETRDDAARSSSDAAAARTAFCAFSTRRYRANLWETRFTQGDLVSLEPLANRNAFVMALHGCNESTRDSTMPWRARERLAVALAARGLVAW